MEIKNFDPTLRVISKIKYYINYLNLNLNGYKVLTEVGSDLYNYIPIIPILAGAEKVMVWTRDSIYGKADHLITDCQKKINNISNYPNVEFFKGKINKIHLKDADIITNSNFLRPLNKAKLQYSKKEVAIPLMYEKWEIRKKDIDISDCLKNGIRVGGTNEDYEKINVFNHIGPLAIKMVFEAGYEIYENNIVIWSDDNFGNVIKEAMMALNPKNLLMTTDIEKVKKEARNIDFIFLADYDEKRSFSNDSFFQLKEISALNPHFGLVHLYGEVNYVETKKLGICCYPKKNGISQAMSLTLSHIGINPFVALVTAGFKVGQCLLEKDYDNEIVQLFDS